MPTCDFRAGLQSVRGAGVVGGIATQASYAAGREQHGTYTENLGPHCAEGRAYQTGPQAT